MPHQLFDLGLVPLMALLLAAGAALYVAGALLFDVYANNTQLTQNNDLAGVKLGFFDPLVSVAMVLAVSLAWMHYGTLVGEIQKETTSLTILAASAKTLPEPARGRLIAGISAYAQAVAGPEWKAMAQGRHSEVGAEALENLTRAYAATRGESPRERLILQFSGRQLVTLAQSREMRLESAAFPLGKILFQVLLISVALAIFLSWFFGLPTLLTKLTMGIIFTWSMILVLVYVGALVHPFAGPVAISNSPYMDIVLSLAENT